MKRVLVLIVVGLVLASNIWGVISARINQKNATGGSVELTESELRLPPIIGDSTALALSLNWRVAFSGSHRSGSADWLNQEKLTELGFDCRIPPGSPKAREHYAAIPPIPVYVVLEYAGPSWKAAHAESHDKSRLFVVDAGRDPQRLRDKFPDRAQHIVTRGIIRIRWQDRDREDGSQLAEPRLGGWIENIIPDRIFVPPPYCKLLQPLRHREGRGEEAREEPRFAVTVSWGAHLEPWVKAVRLLSKNDASSPSAP